MFPFFTIKKRYSINATFAMVIDRLNDISFTKRCDSKYSVYGKYITINPPMFIFKSNAPTGSNPVMEMAATTVVVEVTNENEETVIKARKKPNWIFLIGFWLFVTLAIIKMFLVGNLNEIWILISCLIVAITFIFLDKLFKNILLVSFERDIVF